MLAISTTNPNIMVTRSCLCSWYNILFCCTEPPIATYPLSPLLDHLYHPHYKSPTALLDMHHHTCGISSLLHFVNLILFTLLLVYFILQVLPSHSLHLHFHHLSLPWPFTPGIKLICFSIVFLFPVGLPFHGSWTRRGVTAGHCGFFVLVSFFFFIYLFVFGYIC